MQVKETAVNPQAKFFTIPNILSLCRIALVPLIVVLYLSDELRYLAGIVLIISAATDVIDGIIARKFNMTTDIGKVLDPFADKLTQATTLICLIVRFPLMILPFLLTVIKECFMAISGLIVVKKKGVVMGANWHGKAATVILYAAMTLHVFWFDMPEAMSDILIYFSAAFIALSFVLYIIRNLSYLLEKQK